jgi:hypothetical protein
VQVPLSSPSRLEVLLSDGTSLALLLTRGNPRAVPVRLLLAAVLLLATGVAAAPATAESEPGQLVIEGQGNTTTELVLDRELFLRGGPEPPVLSGGGD